MHHAISSLNRKEVEKILDSPDALRVLEIKDRIGNFPLMTAVYTQNIEMIQLLISKGL